MRSAWAGCGAVLGVSALSLVVVAPAPSYDPWTWLLWGRELTGGTLSTAEGPAFKPLPVAICALLAPLGPVAWMLLVRACAVAAAGLAFGLARRLAGGSVLAGVLGAAGVLLCAGMPTLAATGAETAPLLALALGGAELWRRGRLGWALACAAGCALLRVEAWPFAAAAGLVLWRREPALRPWLVALAVAVPALWFVPEWLASGDPLRSGDRARVPNPGQPALADVPALAALSDAVALPLWPAWLGVAALVLRRRLGAAALVVGAGIAWIVLVAAMAQAGFSGEWRYALPGAVLVAVGGLAALVAAARDTPWPRAAVVLVGLLVAVAAVPRLADLPDVRRAQAYQAGLHRDLDRAIARAGGRAAVLACGTPYTGPYRGPLLAYALDVEKRVVEPDRPPRPPGTLFRSRRTPARPAEPAVPAGFGTPVRTGRWEVAAACRR